MTDTALTPREAAVAFLDKVKEMKTKGKPSWGLISQLVETAEESLEREAQLERAAGHLDDLIHLREKTLKEREEAHQQTIRGLSNG
jgi:hypothetical protein